MNPKKASPKKASAGASRDEEWVPSRTGKAKLERLVEAGVLLDRVTIGWRLASGEPFPMPNTDEVVVSEDYFWHGLGFPVHPFLQDLLEFWAISLCNLHPNTILHISIFIHFYETFLGGSATLQPLQTPVLVEEEGRRWFQDGRRRISVALGWNGQRVH